MAHLNYLRLPLGYNPEIKKDGHRGTDLLQVLRDDAESLVIRVKHTGNNFYEITFKYYRKEVTRKFWRTTTRLREIEETIAGPIGSTHILSGGQGVQIISSLKDGLNICLLYPGFFRPVNMNNEIPAALAPNVPAWAEISE